MLAMRVMRFFCAQVPTDELGGCFLHLIRIKISWESAVEIIRIGPTFSEKCIEN